MNNNKESKKEEKASGSSSIIPDVITGIVEIPGKIGETIINAVTNKKDDDATEIIDNSILENMSETFSSMAETIGSQTGEILKGAADIAGDVASGIVDTIGDVISNIDL